MSNPVQVVVLVEGPTESAFIQRVLAPYLYSRNVLLCPIILSKSGQKGGDVKFARASKDIVTHLKQRQDTKLTLMVDYYGIQGDWPGYHEARKEKRHERKVELMRQATSDAVAKLLPGVVAGRFMPYFSMHEIEALYFSAPEVLAGKLGVKEAAIQAILCECGEPEKINDSTETAPSKRLAKLNDRFKKTVTGIDIAQTIGIDRMRQACPIFHAWVSELESSPIHPPGHFDKSPRRS